MEDFEREPLSPEELKRCEELLDLFMTPGWSHIVEDFTETSRELNSIFGIETEQQLHRNKGKLEAMAILLSYEDTVRRILDDEEDI